MSARLLCIVLIVISVLARSPTERLNDIVQRVKGQAVGQVGEATDLELIGQFESEAVVACNLCNINNGGCDPNALCSCRLRTINGEQRSTVRCSCLSGFTSNDAGLTCSNEGAACSSDAGCWPSTLFCYRPNSAQDSCRSPTATGTCRRSRCSSDLSYCSETGGEGEGEGERGQLTVAQRTCVNVGVDKAKCVTSHAPGSCSSCECLDTSTGACRRTGGLVCKDGQGRCLNCGLQADRCSADGSCVCGTPNDICTGGDVCKQGRCCSLTTCASTSDCCGSDQCVNSQCRPLGATCNAGDCSGHGTPLGIVPDCTCTCASNYQGTFCQTVINLCLISNGGCDSNAVCTPLGAGVRKCTCNNGYTLNMDGATCSDVNECATNMGGCGEQANTHCVNTPGSFNCACNAGFAGSPCVDVDECLVNNGGCDVHGTCTNTVGSFTCSCDNAAWDGPGSTGFVCYDTNECASNNGGCGQVCQNTPGSFTCSCDTGYMLINAVACADIDECLTSNGGCEQNCANTAGSFTCSCNGGYQADGSACDDINECSMSNGGCSQICTNTPGSHMCSCGSGYTGTVTCTDVNECGTMNGGCDLTHGTCTNTPGSRSCSCDDPAWNGEGADGISCPDTDECNDSNGGCAQLCVNTPGSFSCDCNGGYTLDADGFDCDDINECATTWGGCSHYGTCVNSVGSFSCTSCNCGFTGEGVTCTDIDECATDNGGCDPNAVCTNFPGGRTCACPMFFTDLDPAEPGFECENDG